MPTQILMPAHANCHLKQTLQFPSSSLCYRELATRISSRFNGEQRYEKMQLGLGLALFKVVHVDIAVAGNKNEMGAAFQFGVHF